MNAINKQTMPHAPVGVIQTPHTYYKGLTKREYFVAKALKGLCANPAFFELAKTSFEISGDKGGQFYATSAVDIANASIAALNEGTKDPLRELAKELLAAWDDNNELVDIIEKIRKAVYP